jgi:hypothetical protein
MNSRNLKIAAFIVVASGIIAWSPPNSEDLIVGILDDPSNVSSSGGYLGIIGDHNKAHAKSFLVVGDSNTVSAPTGTGANSRYSLVVGRSNTINPGTDSNITGGLSNTVYARSSVTIGNLNTVEGPSLSGIRANDSAAIGTGNQIMSTYGWAIGSLNEVTGLNAIALGTGTEARNTDSMAIGRYNSSMEADDVIVVGSGSSVTNRNTALRVTGDGGVIVGRAQGDISMGIYGN